tara:strand:+ start:117 stop:302 length:186 start_codon:yes stop_codon:yes gene_type:complete
MPVLIIGWSIYDKLPEEEQKEFALVERYRTDYCDECYEYENAKGTKIMSGVIEVLRSKRNY